MEMNQNMPAGKVCNCPHHKVGPIALVLVGLVVILSALNVITPTTTWVIVGILIAAMGIMKLFGRNCNCCRENH